MGKVRFFTLFKRMAPSNPKDAFWLGFIFCLLVCLCILFIISPLTGLSKGFGPKHDGYLELAQNLAKGNGYVFEPNGPPVFHRPPLYPFLLVPITFLPDYLQRPVLVLVQSLMVGCINAVMFHIAFKLFNLSIARIAVGFYLVNPWVYWNAKNPMAPVLESTLYVLFIYLLGKELILLLMDRYQGVFQKSIPISLSIGFVGAALSLTHGTKLAVTSVMLGAFILVGILKRNFSAVRNGVLTGVITLAFIAPWTYRNWVVFNQFIPIVGGSGLGYFNGNVHWRCTEPVPQQKSEHTIDASLRVSGIGGTRETNSHWWGLKDIELEKEINKRMLEDIRKRPGNLIKKMALNTLEFYFPALTYPFLAVKGKNIPIEWLALTGFHLLLWTLTALGLWACRKDKHRCSAAMLLFMAIIIYIIWYFPILSFTGHSLYTFGTMPILSILAAVGAIYCWKGIFICEELDSERRINVDVSLQQS